MKVRSGFVSNSSSSSFIVVFDSVPQSIEEMKLAVFGKEDGQYENMWGDASYSYDTIAKTLFEEMKGPLTSEEITRKFQGGSHPGGPDVNEFRKPLEEGETRRGIDWDAYNRAEECHAADLCDYFMKEHPGKVFLGFHFSDNNGSYESDLEHGGVFNGLPHKCISNH